MRRKSWDGRDVGSSGSGSKKSSPVRNLLELEVESLEPTLTGHIEELLQQGQKESSGRFTLDPVRARELLRHWQLAEPHHYVLSLVSALVGLGAEAVELSCDKQVVQLQGRGLRLADELLHHPLQALFQSDSSPASRELAMGINAALAYPESQVFLWSGSGLCGDYRPAKFRVQELPPPESRTACIEVRRRGDPALEVDELRRGFSYCPIPLSHGEHLLTSSLPGLPQAWCLELLPEADLLPGQRLTLPPHPVATRWSHPAPLHALIQIGSGDNECHWIVMGRNYQRPLPWRLFGELGMRLWVAYDGLEKDLSLGALVENPRYLRICDYLKQQILAAVDRALEQLLARQEEASTAILPLAIYALESSARAGQRDLARALQETLLRSSAPGSAEMRLGLYRQSLLSAGLQSELGSPPRETLDELWESARATLAIRGLQYPLTGQLLWECSELATQQRRWELVVACLEPFGPERRSSAVRLRLGQALVELGRYAEARDPLTQGIAAGELEDRTGESVLRAREQLAQCLSRLGEAREAARQLAEVLRLRQESWGDRSARLGPLLVRLTALCRSLGEEATAAHYERWAQQLED